MFYFMLVSLFSSFAIATNIFSSSHEMEALARHELHLLHTMNTYIQRETSRLEYISKQLKDIAELQSSGLNPEEYVSHPINAFHLIGRFVREWPLVLSLARDHQALPAELTQLPNEIDMQSALRGLSRLQEVYNLNTVSLGQGIVNGVKSYSIMTALECFEMGKFCYDSVQFISARSWLDVALTKINEGDRSVDRAPVLAQLHLVAVFTGCQFGYNLAPNEGLLQLLVKEHPEYQLSPDLINKYQDALNHNCTWAHNRHMELMNIDGSMSYEDNLMYNEMCQGLNQYPEELSCHYVHYHNPRLLLAPFKMEQLHRDPPLVMFHDVISDKEIADMKTEFRRVKGVCQSQVDNRPHLSDYRKCHVGWVEDSTGPTAQTLSRRMADMTNLNLTTAETTQVAHYGLGGEYKLHDDPIIGTSLREDYSWGSRFATLMFYLNNVDQGGRTVFPRLRISVVPRKGSAVLWFNLDIYGRAVDAMLHGGCPVLAGTKWVINKWIHEQNQDFITSCPADSQQYLRNYFHTDK